MTEYLDGTTRGADVAVGQASASPAISLVIVSFNTLSALRECLRSVNAGMASLNCEIIVVDNASADGSADMTQAEFPAVKLIRNDTNLGFAKACNLGIQVATGRYILLLNSDVQLFPDTLQKMVEFMDGQPGIGAAGCQLLNTDGSIQAAVRDFPSLRGEFFGALLLDRMFPSHPVIGSYLKRNFAAYDDVEVDQVSGAFLMVRRQVVEHVGWLDERFFIYYEDVDWCHRIKQAGWKIVYTPVCSALHAGGSSANQFKAFPYVEGVRSKVLYFRKHHGSLKTLLVQMLVTVEIVTRSIVWLAAYLMRALRRGQIAGKGWNPAIAARICRVTWFPLRTRRSATELANA